jgi:hypothetical protein
LTQDVSGSPDGKQLAGQARWNKMPYITMLRPQLTIRRRKLAG